jgi:hypothetical protein
MIKKLGKRRAEIMAFLNGLSEHEKFVVLTYFSNDDAITAHPGAREDRYGYASRAEDSNLDLEFLARRKDCRLEQGPGDRWRIVPAAGHCAGLSFSIGRAQQAWLRRKEAWASSARWPIKRERPFPRPLKI